MNDGQWHNLAAQVSSSQTSLRHIGGDAVAELVVVVGAISSSDLAALESYLKTRHAL